MASSTRQTKRRFQPSITSYFARSHRGTSPPSTLTSHISPLSPPLPATVQSSLLNVGMRVRKSVPEGYKTTSSYTSKQISLEHSSTTGGVHNDNYRGGFAELTPYCGILKIGGYASQTLPRSTEVMEPLQVGTDEYDFVSSQESSISTSSSDTVPTGRSQPTPQSKKRRLEDGDIFGNISVWEDDDMLPSTARFMAVPKTRRKWPIATPRKVGIGAGQENILSDFEEADFLRAPEWVDEEMEMDGL